MHTKKNLKLEKALQLKKCPRCQSMAVLTTLKYCKLCTRTYKNEWREKMRAQKSTEQPKTPKIQKQHTAPEFLTLAQLAQNPLYQRWQQ